MKFKVSFTGHAYVEAETEQEAESKYYDDQYEYKEEQVDEVEEIDEFIVVL